MMGMAVQPRTRRSPGQLTQGRPEPTVSGAVAISTRFALAFHRANTSSEGHGDAPAHQAQ